MLCVVKIFQFLLASPHGIWKKARVVICSQKFTLLSVVQILINYLLRSTFQVVAFRVVTPCDCGDLRRILHSLRWCSQSHSSAVASRSFFRTGSRRVSQRIIAPILRRLIWFEARCKMDAYKCVIWRREDCPPAALLMAGYDLAINVCTALNCNVKSPVGTSLCH